MENATEVTVEVWLINIEKVDLAYRTFKLDFYLWFKFDPSQISLGEIKAFEFVNMVSRVIEVSANSKMTVIVASKEDIFLFKWMTEREADFG